jgi:hypothetical protein
MQKIGGKKAVSTDRRDGRSTVIEPDLTYEECKAAHRDAGIGYVTQSSSNLPAKESIGQIQNYVTIGHDVETGEIIRLGDKERCGGVYVLGKKRTGKSNLLINLARQDMENGHGLLFIDPHADAIADIIVRLPGHRRDDVILLDPTDETYAFGINPLACSNPKSLKERNITFGQAMDIFKKLFSDPETGELGILLSKYLRNSFYPLIENQGYTLLDIELFLTDKQFREHLLKNVSFNPQVIHFWQNEFGRLPKKDQVGEIQSTLNRLNPFLTREYIRDIIGQGKNAIDFGKCMDTKKIVLLRMPTWLDDEVKTFIGIIIISQLLKAVWLRSDITKQERIFFALYCDEFQNFATPDFAKLFTETGKFNIMPAVAHQVREGQLKQGDPNRGATDAAAIKIFFQLAVKDSKEQALTFTKKPSQEAFAISRQPFDDLLRGGHTNPIIQSFTDRYLRPLQYRLEDIKEEMEGEKLLRQYFVDKAALYRVYERIAALKEKLGYDPVKCINAQYNALVVQQDALMGALDQSEKLMSMHQGYTQLRLRLRSLNEFLTSLMEGRITPGNEEFSLFIASFVCACSFSLVPFKYVKLLTLYISLKYGNPKIPRTVPYALAQAHGVFQKEVSLLTHQAMEKTRKARQEFQESYLKKEWESYRISREWEAERRERELTEIRSERISYDSPLNNYQRLLEKGEKFEVSMLEHRLRDYRAIEGILSHRAVEWRILSDFEKVNSRIWLPSHVYEVYVWLLAYPDLWNLLVPYSTAQFDNRWKGLLTNFGYATNIDKLILQVSWSFDEKFQEVYYSTDRGAPCPCDNCKKYRWYVNYHKSGYNMESYGRFLKKNIIKKLKKFLQQYKEGAFVMFELLDAARDSDWKVGRGTLSVPGIAGTEPIEVLRLIKKLNELMRLIQKDYDKFLSNYLTYFNRVAYYWNKSRREYLRDLEGEGGITLEVKPFEFIKQQEKREGLRLLKGVINSQWGWFSQKYPASDELTRAYLLTRVYDLVYFGEHVANLTFPQPTFSGAKDLVLSLVSLLKDTEACLVEKKQREIDERLRVEEAKKREEIERKCAEEMANISIAPLENLDPVVLSENELKALKEACRNELYRTDKRDWDVNAVLKVIEEFVKFCLLLTKPENLLKTRTGQLVTHRTVSDMEAEASLELVNLDPYTAEAKLIRDGKQGEVRIKTRKLDEPLWKGKELENLMSQIKDNMERLEYVRKRSDIEREIMQRQEKWRRQIPDSTRQIPPSEEPPPTYY